MDDDFDESRFRDRVYYEVKTSPSNSTKFDLAKTGWKAWAQVDLCFYLLGRGYDVNVERSANPPTSSVDVIASADYFENQAEVIYLAEVHESEDGLKRLVHDLERNVRDWVDMFQKLEIS